MIYTQIYNSSNIHTIHRECLYEQQHLLNGQFFSTAWISQFQNAKQLWTLLQQQMTQEAVTTETLKTCVNHLHQALVRSSAQAYRDSGVHHRPDVFPAAQPTVSKH